MRHIDYGLGVFDRDVFSALPEGENRDLTTVYQDLIHAGKLAAFEVHDRFYEIGSPEGLRDATEFLMRPRPAVFLDRDGVLNEAVVKDGKPLPPGSAEEFRIISGTAEWLSELRRQGFLLLVVTNQPDVARGNQKRDAVERMERQLRDELPVDDVFTCFHDDADGCDCRKPKPGLITRAAKQYNVDLSRSYLVGDRWRDVDAGANAGCKTILLDRGYAERAPDSIPNASVASLGQGVDWILKDMRKSR
jgi:D-glycero-D-manno-heptose 1,7-bisphosphate phosphatase